MDMINFNTKKATSQLWWIIATAVIAIVVVIFVIVWFKSSGGKSFDALEEKIDELGDCDNDNVANLFDKCPSHIVGSSPKLEGCPDNVESQDDARVGDISKCPKK